MKLQSVGEQTPNGTHSYGPYQIKGHDRDKIIGVCGRDSFPAFKPAWNTIGVELGVVEKRSGQKLVRERNNGDDRGFRKPNWKD